MPLLEEGQIVSNTYEVERFLGEGAFAEVYRVKHRFLGRQAIKVFKTMGMTIEEVESLLDEPILLSRIGHPNIIRMFDANVTESQQGLCGFFTMEYVAGGSLEKFWQSHGDRYVPVETSVEILRQACRGISVAHLEKLPIVHRDIKPQNILIGYDGTGLRVRVSDFGLAKHVNPLTLLASAKGTKVFKAPEVFRDTTIDSCAGDVWALGCTFYMLLTDRLPFTELGDTDFLDFAVFDKPIIPPSRLNPSVNPALDQIIFKALAIDPADRYPNAHKLLIDLEKWRPKGVGESLKSEASSSIDITKTALGFHSPENENEAIKMAKKAIQLSHYAEKLSEAADLMEEAFNKLPKLRDKYEYRLKLWRKGIIE